MKKVSIIVEIILLFLGILQFIASLEWMTKDMIVQCDNCRDRWWQSMLLCVLCFGFAIVIDHLRDIKDEKRK